MGCHNPGNPNLHLANCTHKSNNSYAPAGRKASQAFRTQGDRQEMEENSCPWEGEDPYSPGYPKPNSWESQFKDLILTTIFLLLIWTWKGREKENYFLPFFSVDWALQTEMWDSWLWQEVLPFLGFCQFSQDSICRLWIEWGAPAMPSWSPETIGEENIFSLSLLKVDWLSVTEDRVIREKHINLYNINMWQKDLQKEIKTKEMFLY